MNIAVHCLSSASLVSARLADDIPRILLVGAAHDELPRNLRFWLPGPCSSAGVLPGVPGGLEHLPDDSVDMLVLNPGSGKHGMTMLRDAIRVARQGLIVAGAS